METMSRIETGSVDLMLTDPPYGVTNQYWDKMPNFSEMWLEWERILKPNGAWIFTGMQPFTSSLIMSRLGFFKYECIYEKSIATGFLNAKKQPLRKHENILVFYRQQCTYNPQKEYHNTTSFKRNSKRGTKSNQNGNYNEFKNVDSGSKDGSRFPTSIIYAKGDDSFFDSTKEGLMKHPTQKPLTLFRYLVRTYSNPGDLVFDGYSGSGTTAHACIEEQRDFIGSELNKEYFDKAQERINDAQKQLCLFSA